MADPNFKKISDMVEKTTIGTNDFVPIADMDEPADVNKNKKIKTSNLRKDILTSEMKDGQVTSGKLANDSVIAGKIATGGVSASAQLAAQVVDTSALKDANVTSDKLAKGSVIAAKLAIDAVETVKIKDAQVTAGKLAKDAVETAKIKNLNVTTDKLAAEAVTHPKIKGLGNPPADDDRIAFWDYSASSLGYLDLGTGLAISGTTLNAANIGSTDIADGAVTNAKLGSDVGVWSSWTPTVVGLNAGYQCDAHYSTVGNTLYFQIQLGGTSNGTSFTATLPDFSSLTWGQTYAIKALGSIDPLAGMCQTLEGITTNMGLIIVDVDDNKLVFYPTNSLATNWAGSGNKAVLGSGFIYYFVP